MEWLNKINEKIKRPFQNTQIYNFIYNYFIGKIRGENN
jgi:hypothetical protein